MTHSRFSSGFVRTRLGIATLRALSIVLLVLWFGSALTTSARAQAGSITGPGSRIPWNGTNWYLAGTNYAWYNYGTDFGTGAWGKYTNWNQIASDFATMHGQGVHVVRWWIFADGRYSPEFNADGTVSGLDSQFFSDIDNALSLAAQYNVYLMPTLVDFTIFQTGFTNSGVSGGGHAALITNATVQQSYLDKALKPLLQHVAASPYHNHVIAYDIVNEPEWTISGLGNSAPNFSLSAVQSFTQKCASYIHQYGGAYATLGSGTPYFTVNWKNLGLDFYEAHYYPNFDWNGPGTGLPSYASLNLDRPCIVGEFATTDTSYNIGDTNVQSAQWYMNTIPTLGYAGAIGWGYNAMDSNCSWSKFQTVYTNFVNAFPSVIGPH